MSGVSQPGRRRAGMHRSTATAYVCLLALLGVAALLSLPAPPARAVAIAAGPSPAASAEPSPSPSPDAVPSPLPSADATALASTRQDTTTAPGGGVMGWLSVPAIGLKDVPIYDRGLDSRRRMQIAPGYAVTHYSYSAPLGANTSNAVIYGHDDIEGSVFARLKQLKVGDGITLRLADGTVDSYSVSGSRLVQPSEVGILAATATPTLTLFSCWPLWVDNYRVVVTATPA